MNLPFQTPSGYEFDTAEVFTRAGIFQDPSPADSFLGEYSVDGGAFTQFYLLNTRTTKAETATLTGVSGADEITIRYTYNRDRNVGDMIVLRTSGGDAGFKFNATIVPEPASLMLLGLGGLCMLGGRRHRAA